MAPQTYQPALSALRAVTYRLATTPKDQLPQLVPYLTSMLSTCKPLLSTDQDSAGQHGPDAAVLVHKFRTQLTALLQDRSSESKWTAVVLIKCTVEIGGWETLHNCIGWVRTLIGIISKNEPSTSKVLCIITLTRIYLLTRNYPTLIREITTPSLPEFIATCLNLFASRSSTLHVQRTSAQRTLLSAVLESFNQLLPRHPTIFRPQARAIRNVLLNVLGRSSSLEADAQNTTERSYSVTRRTAEAARRLLVLLHCCGERSSSGELWDASFQNVIATLHRTADKVFRAVVEDWRSVAGASSLDSNEQIYGHDPNEPEPDSMGLPPWSGLFAGAERMIKLLKLLKEHVVTPTSVTIGLRIGVLMDLLTRILTIRAPPPDQAMSLHSGIRLNDQIGRQERENLWLMLPQIHVTAMEVLAVLLDRFGSTAESVAHEILTQLIWVFDTERSNPSIRTAVYSVTAQILDVLGSSLDGSSGHRMRKIIQSSCDDLLFTNQSIIAKHNSPMLANGKNQSRSTNTDSFLSTSTSIRSQPAIHSGLFDAAYDLLPTLLDKLPARHISRTDRILLDRTAIYIKHQKALTLSILNAPSSELSMLPWLTGEGSIAPEVESLLRPRMPVLRAMAEGQNEMLTVKQPGAEVADVHTSAADLGERIGSTSSSHGTVDASVQSRAGSPALAEVTNARQLLPPSPTDVRSFDTGIKRTRPASSAFASSSKRARTDRDGDLPALPVDLNGSPSAHNATALDSVPLENVEVGPSETAHMGRVAADGIRSNPTTSEDDSDDDFIIPQLELGGDSDEEDEEVEEE